ncbi:MAG: DUF5103 domain-containing protein [Flavobacteriales bacterium]
MPLPHWPFALLLGLTTMPGLALADAPPDEDEIRYEDHIYSPTVRTVQLFKKGFELAAPVIELGGNEPLVLRFDDLQADVQQLSYTIVHCTAGWQPSDLSTAQYLAGPPTDFVPTPRQSFNTLQPFIEYELEFPNDLVRPTLSGNYLLKVYRGSDQDDLVLTRRFLVYEQRMQIDARVTATRDIDRRDADQQVDLELNYQGVPVQDPFADLKMVMLQNMRWDDARTGFKPKFIRDTRLIYDLPKEGLFRGGNEWRYYDLKNIRYSTLRIDHLGSSDDGLDEAWLLPDERREYKVYLDMPDLNGRYLVKNDLANGDPLGADYVYVDFLLPRPEAVPGGDVYVYGGFSDMQCQPAFKCTWDPGKRAYRLRALIKQGYVDYSYAFLPANSTVPDLCMLEGSHFQTENDYLVLVYLKDYQLRCERLVGMRFLNTRRG